jgi:hypothetical protein
MGQQMMVDRNKRAIWTLRAPALLTLLTLVAVVALVTRAPAAQGTAEDEAREILRATGVQGGLVVYLGGGDAGDPELMAALRASESYLVHGLLRDAQRVREAREQIRKLGAYGDVCVDRLDGKRLPYVDNLVNLFVAADTGDLSMREVLRVLSPVGRRSAMDFSGGEGSRRSPSPGRRSAMDFSGGEGSCRSPSPVRSVTLRPRAASPGIVPQRVAAPHELNLGRPITRPERSSARPGSGRFRGRERALAAPRLPGKESPAAPPHRSR